MLNTNSIYHETSRKKIIESYWKYIPNIYRETGRACQYYLQCRRRVLRIITKHDKLFRLIFLKKYRTAFILLSIKKKTLNYIQLKLLNHIRTHN